MGDFAPRQGAAEDVHLLHLGPESCKSLKEMIDIQRMMYHVDLEGNMTYEKLNLREERIDIL